MVDTQTYNEFKTQALASQPLRKTTALTNLRFITTDLIEFSGLNLVLSREALKDILRIIGISASGLEGINSSLGEVRAQNLINAIKNAIGANKQLEVTLLVTPDRVVTRINKKSENNLISAETFFDTFEQVINKHNLNIKSKGFNQKTGNIWINTLSDKNQLAIPDLKDEVFQTGTVFSRNSTGISAEPFLNRMICTNGVVTRDSQESITLTKMSPSSLQEFRKHLEVIEKNGFVPTKFAEKVKKAIVTPASLAELERAFSIVQSGSQLPDEDLEHFFKGSRKTYVELHRAGIITEVLTKEQKSSVRTALSVWDVINGITDFASHDYGYELKSTAERQMQVQAGDMLTKQFDTANIILKQPF